MEPRGFRNNNPLNIRKGSAWKGLRKEQTDPAFCQFVTMQYGLRAAFVLLRNYISGFNGRLQPNNTIRKIIHRWAPPTENATIRYVDYVAEHTKHDPDDIVWFSDRQLMIEIVMAMMKVECGMVCERELVAGAYDMVNN